MNRGPFIFVGLFIVLAFSWANLVNRPIQQSGQLSAIYDDSERKPRIAPGAADQGKLVYQQMGCVSCHTQQTRLTVGSDIDRAWGIRQSVARDYVGQYPALIGDRRIGPDLSNVGAKELDSEWHHLHFYNSQITSAGSNMPSYSFLYDVRPVIGQPSDRALDLPEGYEVDPGYEVVPTRRAEALVAYMLSLKVDYDLPEAPSPEKIGL